MVYRLVCACCALIICACTSPVFANNGMEDIATTIRQVGRGGAFIATEPEAGSLAGNPAALAFIDGAEFYLDGRVWHSSLDYTGALNGIGQEENYVIPNIAYVESVNDRFAAGFGIFTVVNSAFRVTDYDISLMGAPPGTIDRTSTKARFVVFTPGLAYKLNDDTSVGAALHYASGSANFQAYNMLGDTVGFSLDDLSGEGYALRLGLFHRANDDTTIGAYWRSRTHLDITNGTLNSGLMTETPGAAVPGTSVEGFQFPEQYGVGIGHKLNCEWTAFGEYRRMLWGKGADTVYLVPPQGEPLGLSRNWSNQDVYVLGAEYQPDGDDTTWRLGTNYAKSCVPDSTINPLYPAITEWHYTAGWEQNLGNDVNLITSAVYVPEVSRTSSADNSFNARVGLGQPYTLTREDWQFGIGLSWKFGKSGRDDCGTCGGCERCCPPPAPCGECTPCTDCKEPASPCIELEY